MTDARYAGSRTCRASLPLAPLGRPPARPYGVFDGAGELLGMFASWPLAHEWAHEAARMPAAVLPIEIEDRAARTTQRITADGCEQVRWMTADTVAWGCVPASGRGGLQTPARVP